MSSMNIRFKIEDPKVDFYSCVKYYDPSNSKHSIRWATPSTMECHGISLVVIYDLFFRGCVDALWSCITSNQAQNLKLRFPMPLCFSNFFFGVIMNVTKSFPW